MSKLSRDLGFMRHACAVFSGLLLPLSLHAEALPQVADNPKTYCNPLNLDYMIQETDDSHPKLKGQDVVLRREAADAVPFYFHGDYYLFASKSGGYWWSRDFVNWTLVAPTNLPLENYSPVPLPYGDALYWVTSYWATNGYEKMFRSEHPKDPNSWKEFAPFRKCWSPYLFYDDASRRLFNFAGCSDTEAIHAWELDPDPAHQFREIGLRLEFFRGDPSHHGWEVSGNHNELFGRKPWIEGPTMFTHNNKYYLQYSAPGTEFVTYGDGVYVGDSPTGPFTYAPYSPICFKKTGFMGGAGNSRSFVDAKGKRWQMSTGTIAVKHIFERRLAMFPMWFDRENRVVVNTYRGDLPQFLPERNPDCDKDYASNLAGWNLLSRGKKAVATSSLDNHPVNLAFDENIKTYWAAKTGNPGEGLTVDLGGVKTIHAIQVNFGEEGMTARGRKDPVFQQYTIECSLDGTIWQMLVDKSTNTKDVPHDYLEFTAPFQARHLRLTNRAQASPLLGKFAVRDLRVFGFGQGQPPRAVEQLNPIRDAKDERCASMSWSPAPNADGYIVSYGIAPDALNTHEEVWGTTKWNTRSLNVGVPYYFAVQAFNESGVAPRSSTVRGK